jgi:hypothetical protein
MYNERGWREVRQYRTDRQILVYIIRNSILGAYIRLLFDCSRMSVAYALHGGKGRKDCRFPGLEDKRTGRVHMELFSCVVLDCGIGKKGKGEGVFFAQSVRWRVFVWGV